VKASLGCRALQLAELQKEARSILQLFRELIRLRKNTAALRIGDDAPLRSHNDILAYERFTATD
jgi:alpha-glucosidase